MKLPARLTRKIPMAIPRLLMIPMAVSPYTPARSFSFRIPRAEMTATARATRRGVT